MSEIVPKALREDLTIRRQTLGGEITYIIKNPQTQQYFRFDAGQHGLLKLFDDKLQLSQLVNLFNRTSEEYEYDLEAATALHNSAKDIGLLQRTREEENVAFFEKLKEDRKKNQMLRDGSIMYLRFHLLDPSDVFPWLVKKLHFLWRPEVVKGCLLLMLAAFLLGLSERERFAADFAEVSGYIFGSASGFLQVWPIILLVIALHEFAHGLTCARFGGEVNDMGFLLMLLIMPCLYCNVNDAWLFENKKHKMSVVAAGVYVELLLGSIALFIWYFTDVGSLLGRLAFVIITISFSATVFFNFNPLIKLDGYYMLADFLEIPNMRQNSLNYVSTLLQRHVLGQDVAVATVATAREQKIYVLYGILTVGYLASVFGGLFLAGYGIVANRFGAAGAILFIFYAGRMILRLMGGFPAAMKKWFIENIWKHRRTWGFRALLAVFLLLLFVWQPRMRIGAICTISARTRVIYAPENAFVKEVGFNDSRQFEQQNKSALLVFFAPEMRLKAKELLVSQKILVMERRQAETEKNSAQVRQVAEKQELAKKEISTLDKRLSDLTISFPKGDWLVEGLPPAIILGRYYKQGEPVLQLVPQRERQAIVNLSQIDLSHISLGQQVRVFLGGGSYPLLSGKIIQIGAVADEQTPTKEIPVYISLDLTNNKPVPPLQLEGKVLILGKKKALWYHLWHNLKQILRFDLWI